MKKLTVSLLVIAAFGLGFLAAESTYEKTHFPKTHFEAGPIGVLLVGSGPVEKGKTQTAPTSSTTSTRREHPNGSNVPEWKAILDRYHLLRTQNHDVTDVWKSCVSGEMVTVRYKTDKDLPENDVILFDLVKKPEKK